MATNVPPAVGFSPAQAAIRIRHILKQLHLQAQTQSAKQPKPLSSIPLMQDAANQQIMRAREAADRASLLTRSEKVKVEMTNIRAHLDEARWQVSNIKPPPPEPKLNKHEIQEAYALIQVIPTIENPTSGEAETILRALTAMLKVYWGVDTEATPAKLPSVMEELLKNLAEKKVQAKSALANPVSVVEDNAWGDKEGDEVEQEEEAPVF